MLGSSREGNEAKQEGFGHHGSTTTTSLSRQWSAFRNPRIVRVSRTFGGKDRHSKVCTIRGLRDRRIRLSVPTALQLYELQEKLGVSQPSKVIDWLIESTKMDIDKLPPLQFPQGFNSQLFHQTLLPPPLGGAFFDTNSIRLWNREAEKGKWIKTKDGQNGNCLDVVVGGGGYNNGTHRLFPMGSLLNNNSATSSSCNYDPPPSSNFGGLLDPNNSGAIGIGVHQFPSSFFASSSATPPLFTGNASLVENNHDPRLQHFNTHIHHHQFLNSTSPTLMNHHQHQHQHHHRPIFPSLHSFNSPVVRPFPSAPFSSRHLLESSDDNYRSSPQDKGSTGS